MFVLNLECPADEVDITSEPDKTWVEFSKWPAARNACVAMLLVSRRREWIPPSSGFSGLGYNALQIVPGFAGVPNCAGNCSESN